MKKQFLKTLLLAGTTMFFFACSTGSKTESEDYSEDSTDAIEEAAQKDESTDKAAHMMVVWHEVKDYDAWRPMYDSNLPGIQEAGMARVAIGRENGNENHVMVVHTVSNLEAAREFSTSEDLMAKMEEAGVTGDPRTHFIDVVDYKQDNITDNLERVMIRHKVGDYETFETVFAEAAKEAVANGLQFLFLGRDIDDPNMITVVDIVVDSEKAEAYIISDNLRSKMDEATVEEDVEVIYYAAEYVDDDGS